VKFLFSYISSQDIPSSILELFAGPAYHGKVFATKFNANVFCIDYSSKMKEIACADNSMKPSNYIVGKIPDIFQFSNSINVLKNGSMDCILILRYSLGYLEPEQVEHLFNVLASLLKPGGVIFIELHCLELLHNSLNDLKIKDRQVKLDDNKRLRCVWPNGPILWSKSDWKVQMPVLIEIFEGQEKKDVHNLVSSEYIYTSRDMEYLTNRIQCLQFQDIYLEAQKLFPQSRVISIRKTQEI